MALINQGAAGIALLGAALLYLATKIHRLFRRRNSESGQSPARAAMVPLVGDVPWLLMTAAYVALIVKEHEPLSIVGVMITAIAVLTVAGDILILTTLRRLRNKQGLP